MILNSYEIWICTVCGYYACNNTNEDLYHPEHLSEHAGQGKFIPLEPLVVKPSGIAYNPNDIQVTWTPAPHHVEGNTIFNTPGTFFNPQQEN